MMKFKRNITGCLLVIIMLLGFLNSTMANKPPNAPSQEEPSVYYTVYKIRTHGENYSKSEDSYETTMLPGAISSELKDKIRLSKIETEKDSLTSVRTTTYKLKQKDRVVIFKVLYVFYDKKPSWRIYTRLLRVDSKDYDKDASKFVEKKVEGSFTDDYYKGKYEILYDGMPFVIEENSSFIDEIFLFIKTSLFDDLDESEKNEIKTRAASLGGRG